MSTATLHPPSGLRKADTPYVRLPGALWGLFVGLAVVGLFTPNPFLTAASILVLPVFMTLLWRPGETPVLLFAVSFQWLQVTAKVFHANFLGAKVSQLSEYAYVELPSIDRAIWLGLGGLLLLAIGMRIGMRKLGAVDQREANLEAAAFSTDRAFLFYVGCTILSTVLQANAWSFGALVQIIYAVSTVKWIGFFVFGYLVLKRKERYWLLAAAVAVEFVSGIGFFSGFKTVLFVTLLIVFTVRYQLKPGTIAAGLVLLAALLVFGAAWTSVKGEYRAFLNQGTQAQATLVSRADQLDKLADLVGELDGEDLSLAMGTLFGRISYVDYFALAMDYVPEVVPHENGALWKQSILHVFTPRALFPDKPALLSDSEMTMQYTGLRLASDAEGTSISIGYMGESYIDFGPVGMFVPILILGLLWGWMYSYFMSRARSVLVGYAFATAVLLTAYQFEMAGVKLVGGVVMDFLVLALLLRFAEKYIVGWLQSERVPQRRRVAEPVA
jgi:hypothetical protein